MSASRAGNSLPPGPVASHLSVRTGYDGLFWTHHDGLVWLHLADQLTLRSGPTSISTEEKDQFAGGASSSRREPPGIGVGPKQGARVGPLGGVLTMSGRTACRGPPDPGVHLDQPGYPRRRAQRADPLQAGDSPAEGLLRSVFQRVAVNQIGQPGTAAAKPTSRRTSSPTNTTPVNPPGGEPNADLGPRSRHHRSPRQLRPGQVSEDGGGAGQLAPFGGAWLGGGWPRLAKA